MPSTKMYGLLLMLIDSLDYEELAELLSNTVVRHLGSPAEWQTSHLN